ncbi:hypothetical protein PISL3812_08634 [Talaromyces islandicus]|uniref:Extracellular protein n=1 Tax=Talaromyces islandicus TaxID=28573 RepID=A0A0U1M7H2_TALIS|nr:hypothetical protein PISL3812_08634 [Talaromyces islandicus]
MKNTFAIYAFLASTASAHMQMSNPYPIRSPLNPDGGDNKDYSYTSPLDASGANFPCKGYQNDAFKSVATYEAGQQYSMSLEGSATHGGGSCQLSLSYDTGKSFTVIESIEGGCPLTSKYSFTIPSDAPSGQALFAWSWFNKIGNREMYMNCAQVTIKGGSSKRAHPRDLKVARDGTAFSSLPPLFIANVNGPGECTTVESQEVKFPEPGPNLLGGVSGPGYTCKSSAPFLGDGSSSTGGSSGSSAAPSSTSTAQAQSNPSPVTSAATSPLNTAHPTTTTTSVPQGIATDSPSTGQACSRNGAIVCGSDGQSWSMCNNGSLTHMGSVAAGTKCANGAINKV